jgi:hypothetical protein
MVSPLASSIFVAAPRPETFRSDVCTPVFSLRKIQLCDSAWLRPNAYFFLLNAYIIAKIICKLCPLANAGALATRGLDLSI